MKKRKAQGATEYAIFIAAVLAGLIALQIYYQRAIKGNMKSRADSVGEQFSADVNNTYQTISQVMRNSTTAGTGFNITVDGGAQQEVYSNSVIMGEMAAGDNFMSKINAAGGALGDSYAGAQISTADYVTATAGRVLPAVPSRCSGTGPRARHPGPGDPRSATGAWTVL